MLLLPMRMAQAIQDATEFSERHARQTRVALLIVAMHWPTIIQYYMLRGSGRGFSEVKLFFQHIMDRHRKAD